MFLLYTVDGSLSRGNFTIGRKADISMFLMTIRESRPPLNAAILCVWQRDHHNMGTGWSRYSLLCVASISLAKYFHWRSIF